jgi:reductive dehalogenase
MERTKDASELRPASPDKIKSVPRRFSEGSRRYVVGQVEKFDQKNDMFKRPRWDPSVEFGKKYYGEVLPKEDKPGYTFLEMAFKNASWWVELAFAQGVLGGKTGLLAWDAKQWGDSRPPTGLKHHVSDPEKMSRIIKKVARFFGAGLVGISEIDSRWIYSHSYSIQTKEHAPVDIPLGCKYAIVTALEMDYEAIRCSPNYIMGAAVGLGYSEEAFTAGLVAQFIRTLGYKALPQGNDTSCSIPLAIDAGLGELARNGLLISPQYGPRVRISKIFTDLPLVPDRPIEFGVWDFCRACEKCADHCPSQAILHGEPTEEIHNISNRKGILRWPINGEKCLHFWATHGACCGSCIRVCPFNKPDTSFHRMVRWHVKHLPQFNRLYKWMDDACGYGKPLGAEDWWDQDDLI